MKLSTYLGLLVFAVLLAAVAHADAPGYPQSQQPSQPPQYYPLPQDQQQPPVAGYPPEQSIYAPPGAPALPPPVLPYPGPQVQVVPVQQPLVGVCTLQPAGPGMIQILLNGAQVLYQGVNSNVQSVLVHYQRIGVCQRVY